MTDIDNAILRSGHVALEYKRFRTQARRKQLDYITKEERRMTKAARLHNRYRQAMADLGLHPLTWAEITDRDRELTRMRNAIDVTHGDTAGMRAAFELHNKGND